jgi:DNA invertase Pin-like site-specific DNA recombinase
MHPGAFRPEVPAGLRAAQYVRMSTDHQKYSPENQRIAMASYAEPRGITIVRSFADEGRSGLTIVERNGLNELIRTVEEQRADFDCILVYDVSRWGRFQDVDESAYYEFICKRSGIAVHYCEEDFENDGSLASVLLKSVSRVESANFSKRLSKRIFMAQSYGVSLGFWRGGKPSFGYRRLAVDEAKTPRGILQHGEQKHFKTDRVILVPGPKSERTIVNRIFMDFADRHKTRQQIANELNAAGVLTAEGNPWQMQTIDAMLRNELYIGHNVFNRRSSKLKTAPVFNPPEMWIRHDNAFEPLIRPDLFEKAQKVLAELRYRQAITDEELLDKLRALWRRKGQITVRLMLQSKGMPHPTVFVRRFGSLPAAYKLAGYSIPARYDFVDTGKKIDAIIKSAVDRITSELHSSGEVPTFLPELNMLSASGATIVASVAWSVWDGTVAGRRSRRWEVRNIRYHRSDLMFVIRMNRTNEVIEDYFLLPTPKLPLSKDRKKLRISDRVFGNFRYETLEAVLFALRDRLRQRQDYVPGALRT